MSCFYLQVLPPHVFQLFHENNYVMATMCFERAKDTLWERRAKAACHRTAADHMRGSNPEGASNALRQAADIYESIGDAESAAQCFCELGEYERAGGVLLFLMYMLNPSRNNSLFFFFSSTCKIEVEIID